VRYNYFCASLALSLCFILVGSFAQDLFSLFFPFFMNFTVFYKTGEHFMFVFSDNEVDLM
jgi:hypothetical protein